MPTLNGNLYRCRARNAFGQVFSTGARLSVVNGYTWTPAGSSPNSGFPLQQETAYSAGYTAASAFVSMGGSLVGPLFSNFIRITNDNAIPGVAPIQGDIFCSIYFGTAGPKTFNFQITSISGLFIAGPSDSSLFLYSLDGSTLIDSDSNGTNGAFIGPLSVTVPAPGQYLIGGSILRQGMAPGLTGQLLFNYTLGVGDQMALVVP